jgi:hypothetical protein
MERGSTNDGNSEDTRVPMYEMQACMDSPEG